MLEEIETIQFSRVTTSLRTHDARTLRVALFGFGVVGSGVWNIIESKRTEFRKRFGIDVEIAGICVRDLQKERGAVAPKHLLTTDLTSLLADDSVDLVFELVGGRYEALDIIERSLDSRKHVITANKLILAHELPRLRQCAERKGVNLFYSASVCGSVPVLRSLDEHRIGDEILSLRGIVNGSTNFILTLMTEQQVSYDEAIKEARARGFLEADPTLDVSGQDAAQKLCVLTYHAFGIHLRPDQIVTDGIERVTLADIQAATARGEVLKLIAKTERNPKTGMVTASVGLESIPRTHLFAHTRDEFNALEIQTRHAGPQMLYGKGAGSLPTASSVVSDLVEVLKEM
jgi:homoserine dehydrogenase